MPAEAYLAKRLRELGLSADGGPVHKRLRFRLYFPRPPYGNVEYTAAKQANGLNFVGQLLGQGGSTLQRIQRESGARIEIHNAKGNLNGTHPDCTDSSLHALVIADTGEKLMKAVGLIAKVVSPQNAVFERFEVIHGGSAVLKPKLAGRGRGPSARKTRIIGAASNTWSGAYQRPTVMCGSDAMSSEANCKERRTCCGAPGALLPGKSWAAVLRNPDSLASKMDVGQMTNAALHHEGLSSLEAGVAVGKLCSRIGSTSLHDTSETLAQAKSVELGEHASGGVSDDTMASNGNAGKGWDAWGLDQTEPYSKFTSATRTIVTEFANKSRRWKQQQQAIWRALWLDEMANSLNVGSEVARRNACNPRLLVSSGLQGRGVQLDSSAPLSAYQGSVNLRQQGLKDCIKNDRTVARQHTGSNFGAVGERTGFRDIPVINESSNVNIGLDQMQKEEFSQYLSLLKVPLP